MSTNSLPVKKGGGGGDDSNLDVPRRGLLCRRQIPTGVGGGGDEIL